MRAGRAIWVAAVRGGHGIIQHLDFVKLPLDSIQRNAIVVIAAEYHVAAARPRLPQAVPELFQARLNLVSAPLRTHLQNCKLLFFVRHGICLFRDAAEWLRTSRVKLCSNQDNGSRHDKFPSRP